MRVGRGQGLRGDVDAGISGSLGPGQYGVVSFDVVLVEE